MKLAVCLLFTVFHCQHSYKIVTLPKADEEQHSMKVFFSTKMVDVTHKVTTTVTQTAYETCYAAEPGITECKNKRDNEESEPKVELNGVATPYESIIPTPSQTARAERQLDLEELEEVVEIIEASENVQVIQPDEVAAVVYASVVHKSKEEEPILVEQVIEELNEVEPFEDELESRTEIPEVKKYAHEAAEETEHEGEIDNTNELVRENNFDLNFEDETQGEMATTEVSEVRHYAHELDDETTTSDPEMAEMTTMMEDFDLEEANPARENLDGPILESSWEEKEVVITNSIDTKCMDMKNDLFINVMSTILWTMTETETVTVNGLNSVLFKSEGGCLPSDVTEIFSSSCV